jgi:cyclophilin family peptidyl-prolyl cis-trans isomerase
MTGKPIVNLLSRFLAIMLVLTSFGCQKPITSMAPATAPLLPRSWNTSPSMQIDTTKTYFANVNTSLGSFKIQLFANETPIAVNNFIFLAQQGFYNHLIFWRIRQPFVVVTGDPTGTGTGGPGYTINDELQSNHSYDIGIVAMANLKPNMGGSQFFICTGPEAIDLNQFSSWTQFGRVISGMDVVQKIAAVPVGPGNPGETSRPINPPKINAIDISVK